MARYTALCLAAAVLVAAVASVHAASHNIGVVRPTSITLTTNDVPQTDVSGYTVSAATWAAETPDASVSLDWSEKWEDAKIKICFRRYNDESWDHTGGQWLGGSFGVSNADGGLDAGDVKIYVKYLGANEASLEWAADAYGEQCLKFDVVGSGVDEANNCANGGSAYSVSIDDAFTWGCPTSTGFNGTADELPSAADGTNEDTVLYCDHNVLANFQAIDLTLTPVDWTDTVYFKSPDTLFAEESANGAVRSYQQQYESDATYIMDVMRDCPVGGPLDGTEGASFWPSVPVLAYYLRWEESSQVAATNIRMDCDNHDCLCNDGTCDLRMDKMSTTLSSGATWVSETEESGPLTYVEADIGWTVNFDAWRCGTANRQRFRLKAFQGAEEVEHTHIGRLQLIQKTSAPSTACQPTIAAAALQKLTFVTLEDDFDANRPAQETSVTGDFTTQHTSISHDAAAGTYSFLLGGRVPSNQQYSNGAFQVYQTVVGMGTSYNVDGYGGYDLSAITDGSTNKVCINIPSNYWSTDAVGGYANDNTMTTLELKHQALFNSYTFPTAAALDNVIAMADDGVGDGIYEYYQDDTLTNPDARKHALYRLMPIRLVSGNVVQDAYITKTGDNYYANWEFKGTLDEFAKCVAADKSVAADPDSRASLVPVSNLGDEEADDTNVRYEFTVFHQHITYRGERTGDGTGTGYLWALAGDDMVHSLTYQITINADSGAMVTSMAASLDTQAELRWARYLSCTYGEGEGNAYVNQVFGNTYFSSDDAATDTANKRLQILLRIRIAKTTSAETRDVGLTSSASKFTNGADASYLASNLGTYRLDSITYGETSAPFDGEETITTGGKDWNVFYVTYSTGCYSTYNSNVGAFVTDAFSSASANPTTFDVSFTLQRVKTGLGTPLGAWEEGFTSNYNSGNTADDNTYGVNVDIVFDHSPVSSLAAQQFSHDFQVEMEITNDAREGNGCTSGPFQCAPYDSTERLNLPQTGKITFMSRVTSTTAVPSTVTGHIREFKMCELQKSPYSGCVGTPAGGTHECDGTSDGYGSAYIDAPAAGDAAYDFGLLGSWVLENKCSKALWTAWLMSQNIPQTNAAPTYAQAAGQVTIDDGANGGGADGYLNPIKGEWVFAEDFASRDAYNPSNLIVPGSSVLCRADDDDNGPIRAAKTVSRYSNHAGWACEASTHCVYETTWLPTSGNVNLYDAITVDMSVLTIGAELRAEVVMALTDCTNERRRLLRGAPAVRALSSERTPEALAAAASSAARADAARAFLASQGRELSTVRAQALSIGANSSMIGFYIEEVSVSYDDGNTVPTDTILDQALSPVTVGVSLASIAVAGFILFCILNCRRRVGGPPRNSCACKHAYAPVSGATTPEMLD